MLLIDTHNTYAVKNAKFGARDVVQIYKDLIHMYLSLTLLK